MVDNFKNTRKKNNCELLLRLLSNYHPNINSVVELNQSRFLDTNIKIVGGKVEATVYSKPDKMSLHRTPKVINVIKGKQ